MTRQQGGTQEAYGACLSQAPERPPLVALLGRAHDAFALEFDRRLRERGVEDLTLALSSNVLRLLAQGPVRASGLVDSCGRSKQAVSQQIAQLERAGYLTTSPDPSDQRARLLRLTPRGEQAQATVVELFAAIEQEWAQRLGLTEVEQLRAVLTAVVADAGCTDG